MGAGRSHDFILNVVQHVSLHLTNKSDLKLTAIIAPILTFIMIYICFSCNDLDKKTSNPTTFSSDSSIMTIQQFLKNPYSEDFLVVYYKESSMSFGSGIKVLKLYSSDSIAIDENFYGAHPLTIKNWSDSTILMHVEVFSSHGDSLYRRTYLNNSIKGKTSIGNYAINYMKDYNN